ncbi:MAG: sulfotransferase, partial [Candidatus Eremiobacteraeota bacterium]|nr:sulfotransferase [Candidatus Eremiobacteraeota bacterium]
MFDKKIVFNSSLPRSGSTLMQNILAQNPRFYCTPTSGVLDLLLASRKYYTELAEFKAQDPDLMQKGFIQYCRYAINGFFEGITDKPVCVDKCRAWFHYHDWIKQFAPNPKYIVCIRDLRAVLSSMEKLFHKNRDRSDPDEVTGALTMITVNNRVMHWLNAPPVGIAVGRLIEAVQTNLLKQLHIVRFEDLTSNPGKVMKQVYDYLDEPYFEHDFNNIAQLTQENDQYHTIYGDHHIRRKVEPVAVDFVNVLGKSICDTVRANYALFYNA